MSENKKIVNTETIEYNGITFKSKLEYHCYRLLEQSGFEFQYEPMKIALVKCERTPNIAVFTPEGKKAEKKSRKKLVLRNKKDVDITYTPDFVVNTEHVVAYFETKGFADAKYPLKRKMFLQWLNALQDERLKVFFEPHSVEQCRQAIAIMNKYEEA